MTTLSTSPAQFGRDFVLGARETLARAADTLGELDRRAGDGDFGTSVRTALAGLDREIERAAPESWRQWLTSLYRGWLGVGGTSGPLFGMLFRELSKAGDDRQLTLEQLAQALADGQAVVQKYGQAQVGDKTMVDALAPAAAAVGAAIEQRQEAAQALEAAERAAVEAAQATAQGTARRGRASYVGEASKGVIDPGAAAVALILGAARVAAGGQGPVDDSWIG